MMYLHCNEKGFETEFLAYIHVFKPFELFEWVIDSEKAHLSLIFNEKSIVIQLASHESKTIYDFNFLDDPFFDHLAESPIKEQKLAAKRYLFKLLVEELGFLAPTWGVLIGIRPTKLVLMLMEKHKNIEVVRDLLLQKYLVHEEKVKLLMEVYLAEGDEMEKDMGIHVYIGIPFCPSRCHYCSFTSYLVTEGDEQLDNYLEALLIELKAFDYIWPQVRTVYIGGGTPTILKVNQLEQLLAYLRSYLGDRAIEFTVEAGRPDTITLEKLQVLKTFGVNRISINPQTMHDKTLKKMGRRHTVDDIHQSYLLARQVGFDVVNMDVILGLPDETISDVRLTIDAIVKLKPDNITVHTLALKRTSKMKETGDFEAWEHGVEVGEMLSYVHECMDEMGYKPYYLYRQKQMVGQHENVGYQLGETPCLYNIHMMEETSSIWAFGAGSVSKRVDTDGHIERAENIKDYQQYIKAIDAMIERKRNLFS